jgi:hypothetical protein
MNSAATTSATLAAGGRAPNLQASYPQRDAPFASNPSSAGRDRHFPPSQTRAMLSLWQTHVNTLTLPRCAAACILPQRPDPDYAPMTATSRSLGPPHRVLTGPVRRVTGPVPRLSPETRGTSSPQLATSRKSRPG